MEMKPHAYVLACFTKLTSSCRTFLLGLFMLILGFGTRGFAQSGNCLDFDGLNDYVSLNAVADEMAGSTDFSIDFIAKFITANQSFQAALIGVHSQFGDNAVIIVIGSAFLSTSDGRIRVFDGGTGTYVLEGPAIGDGNWHHVNYTRSGSSSTLAVDGTPVGTVIPFYSFSASNLWSIGQDWDGGPIATDFFEGQMDELVIVNGATVVGDYGFNQGVAGGNNTGLTTLTDASLAGNNGTLVGFALDGSTSNWVVSSSPLPVEWIDFQARANPNNVLLVWHTAAETDNRGFYIERSADGRQFHRIGFVPGRGQLTSLQAYAYVDHSPQTGHNYYRLVQEDFDGSTATSQVVTAVMAMPPEALLVSPNPVQDILTLSLPYRELIGGQLFLHDLAGHLLEQQSFEAGSDTTITLYLPHIPPGSYLLTWLDANGRFSQRITKQ